MKILVIGSGGREHALVKALKRSPSTTFVTCAGGNAGIAKDVPCVALSGNAAIVDYCKNNAVDLVVVGPEQPLVDGLADDLRAANIPVFGPSAKGAQLEASKDFTKKLCDKYSIPTARYATFDNRNRRLRIYLRARRAHRHQGRRPRRGQRRHRRHDPARCGKRGR